MGTGQMMLAVGSIILLSLTILTTNKNILATNQSMMNAENTLSANAVAKGAMEEIRAKPFDDKITSDQVRTVSALTSKTNFGTSTTQLSGVNGTITQQAVSYKDVDDYDNATISFTDSRYDAFKAKSEVNYVVSDAPNSTSTAPTGTKRIDLKISGKYMQDTLSVPFVRGIWR